MEAIIHRARKGGTEVPAQMRLKHLGRAKVQEDLFQSIRKLARLRAATPALRRGELTGLLVEDGPQRVVLKLQGGKLETIPREDVAAFMLQELERPQFAARTPMITVT